MSEKLHVSYKQDSHCRSDHRPCPHSCPECCRAGQGNGVVLWRGHRKPNILRYRLLAACSRTGAEAPPRLLKRVLRSLPRRQQVHRQARRDKERADLHTPQVLVWLHGPHAMRMVPAKRQQKSRLRPLMRAHQHKPCCSLWRASQTRSSSGNTAMK